MQKARRSNQIKKKSNNKLDRQTNIRNFMIDRNLRRIDVSDQQNNQQISFSQIKKPCSNKLMGENVEPFGEEIARKTKLETLMENFTQIIRGKIDKGEGEVQLGGGGLTTQNLAPGSMNRASYSNTLHISSPEEEGSGRNLNSIIEYQEQLP